LRFGPRRRRRGLLFLRRGRGGAGMGSFTCRYMWAGYGWVFLSFSFVVIIHLLGSFVYFNLLHSYPQTLKRYLFLIHHPHRCGCTGRTWQLLGSARGPHSIHGQVGKSKPSNSHSNPNPQLREFLPILLFSLPHFRPNLKTPYLTLDWACL
jgi:hypothetical protein